MVVTCNMENLATSALSESYGGMFLSRSLHAFTDLGLKVDTSFFFVPSIFSPDFPASIGNKNCIFFIILSNERCVLFNV